MDKEQDRPPAVIMSDAVSGLSYAVQLLVSGDTVEQVLDASYAAVEVRGPLGHSDGFVWLAPGDPGRVIAPPDAPEDLTMEAQRAIDAWWEREANVQ